MHRVYYDYQAFTLQQWGGISRYYIELISRIHGTDGFTAQLEPGWSRNELLPEQADWLGRLRHWPAAFSFRGCGRLQHLMNRLVLRGSGRGAAIHHATYYGSFRPSPLRGVPLVVTVFDMIHEIFPDYFPAIDRTTQHKRRIMERADLIIAISGQTRQDIVEYAGIPPEKIKVVPLGSSLQRMAEAQFRLQLPERFLLYVGNRDRYKNFEELYRAWLPLYRRDPGLKLVCAGGGGFTAAETQRISADRSGGGILYYPVNDAVLAELYSRAAALVVPSLYEGFGLPVVEALRCGCPVVAAEAGSLPEVGGAAAFYYRPGETEQLTALLEALPAISRQELMLQGEAFSWERTAADTAALYRTLL